jgi:polygalacturonase
MKKNVFTLVFALSVAVYASGLRANDRFPDGTPLSEWFRQTEPVDINRLGKHYRITDYGVANDSVRLQTSEIQGVIDRAYGNGGGVVIVPQGTFLTGSLFFRQGVHLHLEERATLKGSDDISDFKIVTTRIEGQSLKYFAALVNADSLDGFTVSGKGTVDGNGMRYWKAFWLRRQWNPRCTNMDEQRPRLLFVSNSKNVQISGVRLINSPFWTSHYYKCENLKIIDVHFLAGTKDTRAPSSDGIDLDACQNVLIKGCYISVNDDAIALKGGKGPVADKDPGNGANRNIVIEDTAVDGCPALTLGSESVHTYNVIMRRCKMKNVSTVLLLKMRPDTPQKHEYIMVEDIEGTARGFLQISPWMQFFDLKGHPAPKSSASGITMRNCTVQCNRFLNIKESEQYTLSDFTFENLNISASQEDNTELDFVRNVRMKNVIVNDTVLNSQPAQAGLPDSLPDTRKPWTRWWWPGNAVTGQGITAALEAYRKAGLGGVEITPIYGVRGGEKNFIEYLSPAWMEKLVYTLNEAKRLGLGVDLANASGWPFGGPWVTEDYAAKYFASKTFTVEGGMVFNDTVKFMQKPLVRTQGSPDAFDQIRREKALLPVAVTANKKGENGFSQTVDLMDKVRNGVLYWNVPEGEWLVCVLFEGEHGKMVERAGPGGEGLVIDHFSSKAMERYLEKYDKAFHGCDLSYLRCFFNDSYEVDDAQGEANFTPGLFSEFEKRNHYRLEDHLPALLGLDGDEINRRVMYDYRTVIGEMIAGNFTEPWRQWANRQGKGIRNQAHGSPANVLDLYALSDIPEIEGGDIVNLKSASSAAHVTGKKLVSSETATWLNEHFESTLGDVKNAVDKMFLAGVNHIFYHGTAYSPQDAPFPGWLFYAAVHFTPQNSFWDDFGTLNSYVANVQKYLQAGKPSNDILLYFPVVDLWSMPARNGSFLQHLHAGLFNNTALKECGDFLTRHGYSWDAVSDKQLQNLKSDVLQSYKLIFVPQTKYMDVRTFEKLVYMAQQGTTVVFYKNMPDDVPGMVNLQQNRENLKHLLKTAEKSPDMFVLNDFSGFAAYSGIAGERFYADSLQSIRRRKDDGGFYYFIRNDRETPYENFISLNADYASAMIYNPMNDKSGYAEIRKTDGKNGIFLQLKPQESLIIETFNEIREGENYPYYEISGEATALSGNWTVDFIKGGPTLPPRTAVTRLESWTNWGEEYAAFSGTAEYRTVIPAMNKKCEVWQLHLEAVNASAAVYLNGKYIRTLINNPFTVEIPAGMFAGNDTLTIRVSNLMANRISDMDKKGIPYRIFYNTNFNARKRENTGKDGKFSAGKWEPKESGISGAVTLTPMKNKFVFEEKIKTVEQASLPLI